MPRYHFDLGDSYKGPLGAAGIVRADSPEHAREILREALPPVDFVPVNVDHPDVEYMNVYFNTNAADLVEIVEEEEDDEEEEEDICDACGANLSEGEPHAKRCQHMLDWKGDEDYHRMVDERL